MAVVTIARQIGALGDEVAWALAERLGYVCVDKNTLAQATSAYSGIEMSTTIPEIDEKRPTFWERLNEERNRYKVLLRSAMLDYATRDRAVILGLGGAHILREYSHVLRVLTVSPQSVRVERVARFGTPERPGPMDREAAQESLRRSDRERSGYVRYLFNLDWMDPARYDLVLNTSQLTVEGTVEVLASAVEKLPLRLSPDDKRRLEETALASRIEATLLSNAGIWVHGLAVEVEGGVVHLTGEVITDEDREIAEEIASQTDGVTRVVNDLRIQPPPLTGM